MGAVGGVALILVKANEQLLPDAVVHHLPSPSPWVYYVGGGLAAAGLLGAAHNFSRASANESRANAIEQAVLTDKLAAARQMEDVPLCAEDDAPRPAPPAS